MTGKLDGGGGGWVVERLRETEIRERSEKYVFIIFILLYINLMRSIIK